MKGWKGEEGWRGRGKEMRRRSSKVEWGPVSMKGFLARSLVKLEVIEVYTKEFSTQKSIA